MRPPSSPREPSALPPLVGSISDLSLTCPPPTSCSARPQVIQTDVDEALRLMRMSKASLNADFEPQRKEDNVSICYK